MFEPQRFGPYLLVGRLGAGGSAEVFLARGPMQREPVVALKRPLRGPRAPSAADRHLREEAEITLLLRHLNVASALSAGEVQGEPYLSLEVMTGLTLLELAQLLRSRDLKCPASIGISVLIDGLRALGYLHGHAEHIVHADVTPRNIMLCRDGRCRLFDFGLARRGAATASASGVRSKRLLGTPGYIAPELIQGMPAHPGSDLFGLGATLYRLLAGRPAYEGSTPDLLAHTLEDDRPDLAGLRPDLPLWLVEIVGALMNRVAALRPSHAARLALELRDRARVNAFFWPHAIVRGWLEAELARRGARKSPLSPVTAPSI